jgi:NAD(P)-dependent dehydrogenase (short-subunit alcohol dehydrogenase family)
MGSRPSAGAIGYTMAKAGIEMFTKGTALELAHKGVRVNCVSPSTIDTNMYRYTGMSEAEYASFKTRASANIPLQRMATTEEVAKAIIFLSGEQ